MPYPSEHTVENLTNHFLLETLNNPNAWLFCPTPQEENLLGFDARLNNHKLIVIQHKGLDNHYPPGTQVKFLTPILQRATLLGNFPLINGVPYVFYATNCFTDYADINTNFLAAPPQTYYEMCVFVDAHTIHPLATYIKGDLGGGFFSYRNKTNLGPVNYYAGPNFSQLIRACRVGRHFAEHGPVNLEFVAPNPPISVVVHPVI